MCSARYPMMKRAISVLLPDLRGGGAERVNLDLAYELLGAGYAVEFVLMQARGELLQEATDRFSVVDLSTPRFRELPIVLAGYLRRQRPDALLAAMWPLTVIAPIAAILSGRRCRIVVSEHGMLSAQYRDWGWRHRVMLRCSTGLAYRLAKHRIGVSSGLVKDMANLSLMKRDDFRVIHNPVSPRAAPAAKSIAAVDQLWGAAPGERILTVGTMKLVKNQALLLRAFALLEGRDATLMFVGDGPERDALQSLARELGVVEKVTFVGFHADPTPFYETADLFVLSSDYEGFGNVIVEALACGTPVVSTDCPSGPAEILDEGRFGWLVPVKNVDALASAMRAALDAPVDSCALRRRASDFSPSIAARKYLDLIMEPT